MIDPEPREQHPETPEQRKARQFASLRRLGVLGQDLAERAYTQAKRQLDAPPRTRVRDEYDYTAAFNALWRAVRQAVAIEIRLEASGRPRPGFRVASRAADPRRILLGRVFHEAVAKLPDRARRRREIDAQIDAHLDADPDQQQPIADTLAALCNALGIPLDVSRLPDELLDLTPAPNPANARPPARAAP